MDAIYPSARSSGLGEYLQASGRDTMHRNLLQPNLRLMLLTINFFLTGCAEQSMPKLDAAVHALEDARKSGAEDYAIEVYTEAEAALFQAEDELDQQQDRLEFFRNYESASAMLTKAINSAAQAKYEAIANKEEAKANAEAALFSARQTLQTIRSVVENYSGPATDHGEFDQLAVTIHAAESLFAETESVMTEENYIGVMTTAHAIESFAGRIQEMIITAKGRAAKRQA
jgi:exonuclease VII small subunit